MTDKIAIVIKGHWGDAEIKEMPEGYDVVVSIPTLTKGSAKKILKEITDEPKKGEK